MTNVELSVPGITMADEGTKDEAPKTQHHRRPRTSEDFYLFCTYVLQYTNYESEDKEETRSTSNPSPPLDSSGSSVNSESTNSGQDDKASGAEDSDESDSFDLITCFCGKPFAGRPMIECSICLTWIHLSCAKIKKSNIPDVFHCAMCKSNKKPRLSSPINSPPDKGVKRPKRTT